MRGRGAALVAVVLVAAGCGASKNKSDTHRTTTGTPTTTAATSTTGSSTDCDTLGINPQGMREGTCTHAGLTYVIVDENHTLKLHTLTAHLNTVRTATSLSGTTPATAQGKFVVLALKLTNRLELPQTFDNSGTQQAGLILAGTVYKEDTSAESASDPESCLADRTPIGPNKSRICQVIFDVPTSAAADLGKHGSGDLYLVDFGSDLSGSISPQTVGQIRLYH